MGPLGIYAFPTALVPGAALAQGEIVQGLDYHTARKIPFPGNGDWVRRDSFSKLKAHLRKAAEPTIPRLSRRIGALVSAFSPHECANYFRHAGYAST